MLPAHIIEKILEQERQKDEKAQPRITLEIPDLFPEYVQTTNKEPQRGVVVIDLLGRE